VANVLEHQGVESFEKSWLELIASVTGQIEKAAATAQSSGTVKAAAD
jgi:transaldolase